MELKGSCHCKKVAFKVLSHTPVPYMYCYCSICLKCQGGGGYAINIMGKYKSFQILTGKDYLKGYHAMIDKEKKKFGGSIRYFCTECGTHLYLYDAQYCSENVYPFASAIDTPLPNVDKNEGEHIMLDYKADWIQALQNHTFKEYSELSFEQWHKNKSKFIE